MNGDQKGKRTGILNDFVRQNMSVVFNLVCRIFSAKDQKILGFAEEKVENHWAKIKTPLKWSKQKMCAKRNFCRERSINFETHFPYIAVLLIPFYRSLFF